MVRDPLTPRREKIPEQRRRFARANAVINLRPMMDRRLRKDTRPVDDRAALWIVGAIIEPRDSGVGDRAGAHRAGFERPIEVAAVEPFVAELRRRHARSEEHTSELQSLMRSSDAVLWLQKK